MRGQIRGLDQATNNANDGISLVQTAEGALNETASILQRMKELATQSSNGTYQNDVDRANIQKEVDSLTSEIDRISTSTNFNKTNLLDGSILGSSKGMAIKVNTVASPATKGSITIDLSGVTVADGKTFTLGDTASAAVSGDKTGTALVSALLADSTINTADLTINGTVYTIDSTSTGTNLILNQKDAGAAVYDDDAVAADILNDTAALTATQVSGTDGLAAVAAGTTSLTFTSGKLGDGNSFVVNGTTYELSDDNAANVTGHTAIDMHTYTKDTDGKYAAADIATAVASTLSGSAVGGTVNLASLVKASTGGVSFQIGDSTSADQQVSLMLAT